MGKPGFELDSPFPTQSVQILELPNASSIGPQVLMRIIKIIMDRFAPGHKWAIETKINE